MSHHIQLLPGLLPLDKTQRPLKKRRLKKTASGEIAYAEDIDEISETDAVFLAEDDNAAAPDAGTPANPVTGRPLSGWFSGPAMKTLLQAQEGK
jgi:hypothetical protein